MAILAWLFLRGDESIRIVRDPNAFVLRVAGPGYERSVHAFKNEDEVGEFQRNFEARLLAEGWILAASQERRSGRDRRQHPRSSERRRTS